MMRKFLLLFVALLTIGISAVTEDYSQYVLTDFETIYNAPQEYRNKTCVFRGIVTDALAFPDKDNTSMLYILRVMINIEDGKQAYIMHICDADKTVFKPGDYLEILGIGAGILDMSTIREGYDQMELPVFSSGHIVQIDTGIKTTPSD